MTARTSLGLNLASEDANAEAREPDSAVRRASPAPLVAVRIEAYDPSGGRLTLRVGAEARPAILDASVDPVVVSTALSRGERVIAQEEGGEWVVLGALRTSATPGVDEGDDYVIRARRVTVAATHEFSVTSGLASLYVRATGHVETIADHITSRASRVHKIIGRMLRLN